MDAKKFLKVVGILKEGFTSWIIKFNDGRNVDVVVLMDQYAKEKVKEVVKQIHSQSKDGAITSDWIGFKSFID